MQQKHAKHAVSNNRRGRCLEHEVPRYSKKQLENRERIEAQKGEGLGRNIKTQLAKASQPEGLADCGSEHCAGCYEVGDGIRVHPPRSDY